MRNYIVDGDVINYATTTAVNSGDLVQMADLVGVAATNIAAGDSGSVNIDGVFEVPKSAGFVAAQGSKLYYDSTAKALSGTAAGNTLAGYAYESAANGDVTVRVRLIG